MPTHRTSTISASCRAPRLVRGAGAALLACVLAAGGFTGVRAQTSDATDYFTRLEHAPFAVVAHVSERRRLETAAILVYELTVSEVLKGSRPWRPSSVAQELIFHSDRPFARVNDERIFLLEPLPENSRNRSLLPQHKLLRVVGRSQGLRSPAAAPLIKRYLRALARPPAQRLTTQVSVLADALRDTELGDAAASRLGGIAALAEHMSPEATQSYAAALADRRIPRQRRRALLRLIGRRKLLAMKAAAQATLSDPDVAPHARAALAALGETIDAQALRADLAAGDSDARVAALHAAGGLPQTDRLDILSSAAQHDPEPRVRAEAIQILGREGPPAVDRLAGLLEKGDLQSCYYATHALAGVATPEAVGALERQFSNGSYDAQVAAVFALRSLGTETALRTLARIRRSPPDPRLRKVIDIAAGRPPKHE